MHEDTQALIHELQSHIDRLQYILDHPFSEEADGINGSLRRSMVQYEEQKAILERSVW